MTTLRFSDGGVAVTLDGGLERFVQGMLDAAETATIKDLRAAASEIAESGSAAWYGSNGVKRRTGKSGDIQDVLKIDASRDEIRVSVGSTDTRAAGKSGKVVPLYVHRPTRTSTMLVQTTPPEWYAAPKRLRGPWVGTVPNKIPHLHVLNPAASDGKYLLPLFVREPMRRKAKEIAARLGASIGKEKRDGK